MSIFCRLASAALASLALFAASSSFGQELYQYKDENGETKFSRERKMDAGYVLVAKDGWSKIGTAPNISVWVQDKSIAPKGRLRKAWFQWSYSNTQKTKFSPPKDYSHSLQLNYFDCVERTSAVAQILFYSGGETVDTWMTDVDKMKFSDAAPESMGEGMMDFVCKAKLSGAPDSSKNNSFPKSASPK